MPELIIAASWTPFGLPKIVGIFTDAVLARLHRFGHVKLGHYRLVTSRDERLIPILMMSRTFDSEMSEDCLALNAWAPGLRDGVKCPVW
jgi:hypothetical protein